MLRSGPALVMLSEAEASGQRLGLYPIRNQILVLPHSTSLRLE
jgi:hypothetical protein